MQLFDEGRLLMFQNDSTVPDWAQVPSGHLVTFATARPHADPA